MTTRKPGRNGKDKKMPARTDKRRHPAKRNKTTWKPGQSGNPEGSKPKPNSLASLWREVAEEIRKGAKEPTIKELGRKLRDMALEGNIQAARLFVERIYGAPAMAHDEEGDDETEESLLAEYLEGHPADRDRFVKWMGQRRAVGAS